MFPFEHAQAPHLRGFFLLLKDSQVAFILRFNLISLY
jgi:hypothetical protein